MPRQRMIKPDFWNDEVTNGKLTFAARLAYIASWNFADDAGRLRGALPYLQGQIFPFDEGISMTKIYNQLVDCGKWIPYIVNGQHYIYIPNFLNHQTINRAMPSTIPEPPIGHVNSVSDSLNGSLNESVNSTNDSGFSESVVNDSRPNARGGARLKIEMKGIEIKNTPNPFLKKGDAVDPECGYCGVKQSQCAFGFEVDHFIPRNAGGTNDPSNKITSCHTCNQIKGSRIFKTIEEAREYIHEALWSKNRKRYIEPRKVCFGGQPPESEEERQRKCKTCGSISGARWVRQNGEQVYYCPEHMTGQVDEDAEGEAIEVRANAP